jgi:hypothetical protein
MINNGHIGLHYLRNLKRKANEATNNPSGTAAGIGGSVCINRLRPVEAGGGGMTKDEALDLALEALENSVDLVREDAYNAEKLYGNYPTRQGKVRGLKVLADDHENAITATKQALATPVQEPDAYMYASIAGPVVLHRMKPMGVATVWCVQAQLENDIKVSKMYPLAHSITPLYTTPPAQPTVPDAIGPNEDELPAYAAGWNDCRQAMLERMK